MADFEWRNPWTGAMPFLHPILFWMGVAGMSIPVVIHLLNRRRYRVVEWAAMRFLREALRKNRRRMKLEEWLLLGLRCLGMLLLGAALARFAGCGEENGLAWFDGPRTHVFVLDDSASMGQRRGQETLFAAARRDVQARLSRLRPGDRAAILLSSKPAGEETDFPLGEVADAAALSARLDGREPTDRRTSLAEGLETARRLLTDLDGEKRVVVMSDFRRADLEDAATRESLRVALTALHADGAKTTLLDYGREARRNLTIERLELIGKNAIARQPARFALCVRNNGATRSDNATVELAAVLSDGASARRLSLAPLKFPALDPGERKQCEFTFTPGREGFAAVSAELPADALSADNRAVCAMEVRSAVKILIVDGNPARLHPTEAESYFLRAALDPAGNGEHGFSVETIRRDDLPHTRFDAYDLIFLLNLSDAPLQSAEENTSGSNSPERYASLASLEAYVRSGGGLVIYTGDRLDMNFYNDRLYNKGLGLLPMPVRPPRGDAHRADRYVRLDAASISPTGVMNFFAGPGAPLTKLIRFFAYTPLEESAAAREAADLGPAVVEARFADPERHPAVVSRRFGRGTVVLIASTASTAWNDWALDAAADVQGLYVLFVADLAERLARAREPEAARWAGQPLRLVLEDDWRDARAVLTPPGKGAEILSLSPRRNTTGRWELFAPADAAGLYQLRLRCPEGPETLRLAARNVDPSEGRLAPAGREGIFESLGRGLFSYVGRAEARQAEATDGGEEPPHWKYVLLTLLAVLGLETYLARRFGHG